MQITLKKTLLAALPLAGLLFLNSPVSAHDDWQHGRFHNELGDLHRQEHSDLNALHREFHEYPYSRREHRGFHRWSKREHRGFHNDLYDLHRDYHDRDWSGGRRYDGNGGYYGAGGLPWWDLLFAR